MKGINMKVYFYQAECGDAARLSYKGSDGRMHHLFIDAGFERTFRHILASEIQCILDKGQTIDAWFISHIHDDHIGGVIRYLDTISTGEFPDMVKQWYYNAPRHYPVIDGEEGKVSSIASIGQGDTLYEYLASNHKLLANDVIAGMTVMLGGGLEIQILSPIAAKLERLRKKYKDVEKALESDEADAVSTASAPKEFDYSSLVDEFDLSKWTQDKSIENGSSVSMLTTFAGKSILWLADCHPSDVANSLKKMGYTPVKKLKCEWVKVSHHGSKGNNSDALYSLVECENYLISANGENNHCLPTKEALVRILKNKNRSLGVHYRFYFTYDNSLLRSIFENENKEIFEKYDFELIFLSGKRNFEFSV